MSLAFLGVSRTGCGWVAIQVGVAGSKTPPESLADPRGVGVSLTAPSRASSTLPGRAEGWEMGNRTGNGVSFAVPLAMVGLG